MFCKEKEMREILSLEHVIRLSGRCIQTVTSHNFLRLSDSKRHMKPKSHESLQHIVSRFDNFLRMIMDYACFRVEIKSCFKSRVLPRDNNRLFKHGFACLCV